MRNLDKWVALNPKSLIFDVNWREKIVRNRALQNVLREHMLVLVFFTGFSILLTWPLLRDFSTAIVGMGDARHHLWILWHTKEALFTSEPLFYTSLLYYPNGTTLLTSALGPLTGILALPFWGLGPEAAYNGALLIGFILTGYCMYLLARDLQLGRPEAFFASILFLMAPIHLAGIFGHLSKVFLGALPLVLLTLHRTLDLKRSVWWAVATALMLLLALLQSGEQFVFAGLAIAFFLIAALLRSNPGQSGAILKRVALLVVSTLTLCGPILAQIFLLLGSSYTNLDNNLDSLEHQPDLFQFFIPPPFARFVGSLFAGLYNQHNPQSLETYVYLAWTGLLLCGLVLISRNRRPKPWLLLTLFCFLLAFGPNLRVLGQTRFTEYNLPIIMPYAFLTALPGFDFMRTPGRFMLLGYVGFSIAAAYGLTLITSRFRENGMRLVVVGCAVLLVLLETWPAAWPQERLRPVPEFYQQLAQDKEQYGVFDLPVRPYQKEEYASRYTIYASYYQMYQMTHQKGIASGYIDRPYAVHPLFGHFVSDSMQEFPRQSRIFLNGEPADRYANMQRELAQLGYRYVVYHKPQDSYVEYEPDSWGEMTARSFLEATFNEAEPIVDDELVTVYQVDPAAIDAELVTSIALRGWDNWPVSPATFYVTSPNAQIANLDIIVDTFRDAQTGAYFDDAVLTLQSKDGFVASTAVAAPQEVSLPLLLDAGSQIITLTIQSEAPEPFRGNQTPLSVDLRLTNLQTSDQPFPPPDILVNGQVQAEQSGTPVAFHGSGWYNAEAPTWRWASSPATLFIQSPIAQQIHLALVPVYLYNPDNPADTAQQGEMTVAVNDGDRQTLAVEVDQPVVAAILLEEGWNTVEIELDAGNFKPDDHQPGSGDTRTLSFALGGINIQTGQE